MTDFDPTHFCTVEAIDGSQYVTIDPNVMYPAVFERIEYVLTNNAIPDELIYHQIIDGEVIGQSDRAKRLLRSAKALPDSAWEDARKHRKEFITFVGYLAPNKRPPLEIYASDIHDAVQRLWARGDALEVAVGWFLHALRIKIGGSKNTILSGKLDGETDHDFFHYQL